MRDCMSNFSGDIVHHHQSSLILQSLPFDRKKVILRYIGANPQFEENPRVAYEARQIRKYAPKAAAIITVSKFAKKELQELFDVKSEIHVVHSGSIRSTIIQTPLRNTAEATHHSYSWENSSRRRL